MARKEKHGAIWAPADRLDSRKTLVTKTWWYLRDLSILAYVASWNQVGPLLGGIVDGVPDSKSGRQVAGEQALTIWRESCQTEAGRAKSLDGNALLHCHVPYLFRIWGYWVVIQTYKIWEIRALTKIGLSLEDMESKKSEFGYLEHQHWLISSTEPTI